MQHLWHRHSVVRNALARMLGDEGEHHQKTILTTIFKAGCCSCEIMDQMQTSKVPMNIFHLKPSHSLGWA